MEGTAWEAQVHMVEFSFFSSIVQLDLVQISRPTMSDIHLAYTTWFSACLSSSHVDIVM